MRLAVVPRTAGREGETELENPDVWMGRKGENRVQ